MRIWANPTLRLSLPAAWFLVAFATLLTCHSHFVVAQDVATILPDPPATLVEDPAVTDPAKTDAATSDEANATESAERKPKEQSRKSYLGRVVAPFMSHVAAPWLVRPERDQEENASESFDRLDLKPGMVVCDLGCGNGFWTLPMARKVGAQGAVYAVDIQREMLQELRQRADQFDLKNIRPVLGTIDDPKLPLDTIDLLLMVDVYHEFSHPQSMLWEIRRALKPTGVIALLEYRLEDPTVPIKLLHKMTKDQIMKEYAANGFKLVREYNELPWQHLMFFARDDSPLPAIEPEPTEAVLQRIHQDTPVP